MALVAASLSLLPNPTRKTLAKLLLASVLCMLSYLLGVYVASRPDPPSPSATLASPDCLHLRPNLTVVHTSSSSAFAAAAAAANDNSPPLDFEPHHFLPLPPDSTIPQDGDATTSASASDGIGPLPAIPFCPSNFTDYCPCQDPFRERRYMTDNLFHRERHCPAEDERVRCRVPRPKGYRTPFRWPESRDRAWFANAPSKRLSQAKADQHWVRVEGERLVFPGGGTSFPGGVKGYVADLAKLVPIKSGEVRTVLDIGCGVASFGGHLLDYNILTMSVAPRDVHEAQVQFALERGLPAMLGVLSIYKLPYPSRSFDMGHCARCLIQWAGYGGLYLLEIDRVLRPGGYWVLSGPPINYKHMYKGWKRPLQELQAEQRAIEDLAKQLCWKKIAEKGPIAAWRKPSNHIYCSRKLKVSKSLPFCEESNLDSAWYQKMYACISPLPNAKVADEIAGGPLEKWPKRLSAVPPRITRGYIEGISSESFNNDYQKWNKRLAHYESYIHFHPAGKYRNIMDMNAGLGGLAAALTKYPVWVMNAVPVNTKNDTLGIIYERGLIGTYMDWCEAFSTYPRTYDLIHANGIFSMYIDKCDIIDILLEMDRILRPEGAVIIRDHIDIIVKAKRASERLGWRSRIVHNEVGDFDPEKLLIVDNSINVN